MGEGVNLDQAQPAHALAGEHQLADVQLIELGGNHQGGMQDIPLSQLVPLAAASGGFKLDNQPSDLLTVFQLGHQQLGVVDTRPHEPKSEIPASSNRLALAMIDGDPRAEASSLRARQDQNGQERYVWLSDPSTKAIIGRTRASVHFDEQFGLSHDGALDPTHFGFRFSEDGALELSDNNTAGGTTVFVNETMSGPDSMEGKQESKGEIVQEELGETAVEEVVEQPRFDAGHQIESRQQQAIKELEDNWGLPEGEPMSRVVTNLDTTLGQLDEILVTLTAFDRIYSQARQGITASIDNNADYLAPRVRQDMQEQVLLSKGFITAKGLSREGQIFLPSRLRASIDEMVRTVRQFELSYREMAPSPGQLRLDNVDVVLTMMDRLPQEFRTVLSMRQQVEEMKQRLVGFHDDSRERESGEIEYRNQQVAGWAESLGNPDLSKDKVESIRLEMEQAVRLEAEMVDDPNSPSKVFDDGIRNNRQKSRSGGYASRRQGGLVGSQKYISEMMLDMLSGRFDVEGADEILLDPTRYNGVQHGLHRASALAMLYGVDNWAATARQLGYKVKNK